MSFVSAASARYLSQLTATRDRVHTDPWIRTVLSGGLSGQELLGFLIQWCATGTQIHEPLSAWLDRAGRRSVELGFAHAGDILAAQAQSRSHRHRAYLDGLFTLVPQWNRLYSTPLDADVLWRQPADEAALRYVALHQELITGTIPFAEAAVVHELDCIGSVVLPSLRAVTRATLGNELGAMIADLEAHIMRDDDRSRSEYHLEQILAAIDSGAKDTVDDVAAAAAEAVHVYLDLVVECIAGGRELATGSATGSGYPVLQPSLG